MLSKKYCVYEVNFLVLGWFDLDLDEENLFFQMK